MSWKGMGIRTDAVQCDHPGCQKWAREKIAEGEPRNELRPPKIWAGLPVPGDGPNPFHYCCAYRHCRKAGT